MKRFGEQERGIVTNAAALLPEAFDHPAGRWKRNMRSRCVIASVLVLCLGLAACDDDSGSRTDSALPLVAEKGPLAHGREPSETGKRAFEHVRALVDLGPRPSGSEAYGRQVQYLRAELEQSGWACTTRSWIVSNPVTGQDVRMTNLYARFGGKETDFDAALPGILSCHIDTKSGIKGFVGANDGASGAAVLLETARALATDPETARSVELVFFDGEESFAPRMQLPDGLYGSTWEAARRESALPRWMVNLDMVGRRGMRIAVPADDTSQEMYDHYMRAIRELGASRGTWQVALGSIFDDHRPFYERGVHTLNLIDSFARTDWWHTAQDNLSLISADSLAESVRMAYQLLKQLARDADLRPLSGSEID